MQKKKALLQMYADENADYTNFIPRHVIVSIFAYNSMQNYIQS